MLHVFSGNLIEHDGGRGKEITAATEPARQEHRHRAGGFALLNRSGVRVRLEFKEKQENNHGRVEGQ
jgi:hypothetical protein